MEKEWIDPLMESKLYYDLSAKLVDIFNCDLKTVTKPELRPSIIRRFLRMFETIEYLRDSENYKIEANRLYDQLDKAGYNCDFIDEFRTLIENN